MSSTLKTYLEHSRNISQSQSKPIKFLLRKPKDTSSIVKTNVKPNRNIGRADLFPNFCPIFGQVVQKMRRHTQNVITFNQMCFHFEQFGASPADNKARKLFFVKKIEIFQLKKISIEKKL